MRAGLGKECGMQKLILFNNLSLDGRFCDAHGDLDWAKHRDDELTEYVKTTRGEITAYMFGRHTFEMFAGFWPTAAGRSANPYFARVLTENRKIVFSSTLKSASWENTVIEPRTDAAAITRIKSSLDGDGLIFGSGTLVQFLTEARLIDEYQFLLSPVVLGGGRLMFETLSDRLKLRLVETKPFKNGTILVRYLVDRS